MSVRLSALVMMLAVGATFGVGAAQDGTGPATAPATMPATVPADPTTPKGTLKLLSAAMERGDVAAMRELMMAGDPVEQKMVAAQVGQAQAFARFRGALVNAFGQQAMEELMAGQQTPAQRDAILDAADAKVDGDTASVVVGQDTYQLKKVGNRWLLSLTSMAKSVEPAMLEESLQQMTMRSQVMQEIAGEIAEGKYQNTDQVGQAVQGKLMVAMMRDAAATQEATTQPGR